MNEPLDHCRAQIARLQSWRGWLSLNRKNELAHYQNMLLVLLRAEQHYKLKVRLSDPILQRAGTGHGQRDTGKRASGS